MTDIMAPQISAIQSAIVPTGTAINPLFDWVVMVGVPFWVFVLCFLIFCMAAVWVYWIARINKLSAVKGWKESLQKMSPNDVQVWLITRTLNLIIGCMEIEDNVLSYHDKTKLGMWHHNTRESVIRVGGNPAVVVSEDFDQTRDFISEIALTDNSDEFNANQETLKKEMPDSKVISPINDYADYETHGRKALQMVHPDGLPMKSYNLFNNLRFLKYFPKGCSHMFFGTELAFDARLLKPVKKDQGFLAKHALLIIVVIVIVAALAAAWFVPLGH